MVARAEFDLRIDQSFTIAFSPRCGSNELCWLLSKNGMGRPGEVFHDFFEQTRRDGQSPPRFSEIVKSNSYSGIFGSKVSHDHRAAIDERLTRDLVDHVNFSEYLANHRWIWMKRKDKIAQAVSLCIAELTNAWTSDQEIKSYDLQFDFYHILSRLMILVVNDLIWEEYFRDTKVSPYVIIYEEFFTNTGENLRRLVTYIIGTDAPVEGLNCSPTLAVQRDLLNKDWCGQFQHRLERIGGFDAESEFGVDARRWADFFGKRGWRAQESVASPIGAPS